MLSIVGTGAVRLSLAARPTLRLIAEPAPDLGTGLGMWVLLLICGLSTAAYWAFVALLPLHV